MSRLELFARALYGLISQRQAAGQSVREPAQVNRPDRSAGVVFNSGVRGLLGGGRDVHSWASTRIQRDRDEYLQA
jgi:hypothetical protein